MIVANVKIHYGAYSKRYYTYWSQDVSGGCFHTIIPSGNGVLLLPKVVQRR